jgi:hypothetical protein
VEFRLGPPLGPHPLLDELVAARIDDLDRGEVVEVVVAIDDIKRRYGPTD